MSNLPIDKAGWTITWQNPKVKILAPNVEKFSATPHNYTHTLTEHTGNTINTNTLHTVIYPHTGHTQTDNYKDKLTEHITIMRTKTTTGVDWKTINKQILPAL